jgi:atypical dual specificity phosphatase
MRQLHIRTVDYTPPALEDIAAAVRFMAEATGRNERVYVHCKAGRGRSATVVLCYLIQAHRIAAREGQQWLLRVRPHVSRHLYRRPVVMRFEQQSLLLPLAGAHKADGQT